MNTVQDHIMLDEQFVEKVMARVQNLKAVNDRTLPLEIGELSKSKRKKRRRAELEFQPSQEVDNQEALDTNLQRSQTGRAKIRRKQWRRAEEVERHVEEKMRVLETEGRWGQRLQMEIARLKELPRMFSVERMIKEVMQERAEKARVQMRKMALIESVGSWSQP